MLRGVVKACSLCMLLLQHVVDGYGSGRPSFGMPNSYNMVSSILRLVGVPCTANDLRESRTAGTIEPAAGSARKTAQPRIFAQQLRPADSS